MSDKLSQEELEVAAYAVEHLIFKHGYDAVTSRGGGYVSLEGVLDKLKGASFGET